MDLSLGAELEEELEVEDLLAELRDSDEELEEPSSSSDPDMPSVLLAFWRLHSLNESTRQHPMKRESKEQAILSCLREAPKGNAH